MSSEHWQKWALIVMAGLLAFFGGQYFKSGEGQNMAQWQEIAKVKERMARIEGFHEAERFYGCRERKP